MKTKRETPIRNKSNPWVCSVQFAGETNPRFLVGNAGPNSDVPLLFTDNPGEAIHAETQGFFTSGWAHLILSHGLAIGKKPRAVVHRLNDTPIFATA